MNSSKIAAHKNNCFGSLLICLGCTALIACCAMFSNLAAAKPTAPNIIYILADDLGYGDVGVYGQTKLKTPYIDSLAKQGIKFTQHYSGSTVCGPSRASLITGLHSGHSPIRGNPKWTASGKAVSLKKQDLTIAEMLKSAGYQTAAIGKWGLSESQEVGDYEIDPAMPNQQGFDYFFGYKYHVDAHFYYWNKLWKNNTPYYLTANVPKENKGQYTHDLFTQEALSYVGNVNPDKPFFLYLAYTIPHAPLTVPEDSQLEYRDLGWPKRKMNTKGHYKHDAEGNVSYAGMITRMDRDIGKLVELLKRKGLDKNTLVIFTSDNGPDSAQNWFNSNGDLKGKKRDLYEGGIRVPMVAYWPETIAPMSESQHISAFWDVMPTFCQLAGADQCPKTDGISFVPTLLGKTKQQQQHKYLYWEFNERKGPIQAVRAGNWKLLRMLDKAPELYDLSQDIGETTNVASANPNIAKRLESYMDSARSEHKEFPLRQMIHANKRNK